MGKTGRNLLLHINKKYTVKKGYLIISETIISKWKVSCKDLPNCLSAVRPQQIQTLISAVIEMKKMTGASYHAAEVLQKRRKSEI